MIIQSQKNLGTWFPKLQMDLMIRINDPMFFEGRLGAPLEDSSLAVFGPPVFPQLRPSLAASTDSPEVSVVKSGPKRGPNSNAGK